MREEQLDQQLGRLDLFVSADEFDWSGYLNTRPAGDESVRFAKVVEEASDCGAEDCGLIGLAVAASGTSSVVLVTNDEVMLHASRRAVLDEVADPDHLRSMNSTEWVLELVRCGAFTFEIAEACLVAEYKNIEEMERRGLKADKRAVKIARLEEATQQLSLLRIDSLFKDDPSWDGDDNDD